MDLFDFGNSDKFSGIFPTDSEFRRKLLYHIRFRFRENISVFEKFRKNFDRLIPFPKTGLESGKFPYRFHPYVHSTMRARPDYRIWWEDRLRHGTGMRLFEMGPTATLTG